MKGFLTFLPLVMVTLLLGQVSPSQSEKRVNRRTATATAAVPASDRFESSLAKIRIRRPEFNDAVVNCDKAVIQSTLPSLTEKFKEVGFTTDDAIDATLSGWENVRLTSGLSTNKCMVEASFQKYVGSLGRMSFRSSPSEALIEVDSNVLGRKTNFKRWFEPRDYKVRFSKPDCCLPVEMTCTINERAETDCFAELPQKP
jgi:hypothetical protein